MSRWSAASIRDIEVVEQDSSSMLPEGSKEPYKRAIGCVICPMLDLQWSASRWPFNNFFQFRAVLGSFARKRSNEGSCIELR
jgi:hypothetical protein